MKRKSFTLAFWALFLFAGILTAEAHQYKLIRIFNSESFAPDRGIECVARNGNSSEFVVNSHEYAQILKTCDSVEVIINDLEAYYSKRLSASKRDRVQSINGMPAGSMSGYYKLDEIYDFMENLTVDFPELVTREEIGRTWEDRPIWAYTIGCSDGECPEALLTALHHAREPMSVMSLLHFIYNLFENYLNNNPEAIYIMNNRRMVVVPVVNPDGYAFNQRIMPKGGGFWRRNRRPINDTTWGVDLNRNYGPHYLWDHPNGGSSTDIQSDTYRGPAAFSEPETRAIRDLCLRHNFRIALNLHSWGNLLLYPWGVLDRETEDSVLYRAFSQFINLSTKYVYGLDSETVGYIARGASDDWLYLESPEKPAIIAFTPEIGNRLDGFWPQSDRIAPLTANNLPLFYETAHSAGVNIRPVDYSIEYSENESQKLSIRFCNIGTGDFDGEKDVIVRPLNNKIKVKYPDRKIYILPSGRSQTITFDIDYEKGFPNGDIVPFEVSVSDEQLGRKDTLDVRLVIPKTIVMYDGQTLREQWDAGDWGLQFIEFAKYYLSDSPFEEYAAATDNYITWREPIDLTFAEAAELEIASRWMIERTYDFAVAQISTNGGETWEYLRGTRSV
ncbi:MAG: M14 family zinc carboxypeptidase, partial [Candidatus Kapaibacterium sp.]